MHPSRSRVAFTCVLTLVLGCKAKIIEFSDDAGVIFPPGSATSSASSSSAGPTTTTGSGSSTTGGSGGGSTGPVTMALKSSQVTKVDLLFMIDNSSSMADK